jgi:hypothetical protein
MSDAFGTRQSAPTTSPLRTLRIDLLLLALFCVLALGGTAVVLVHEERQALDDPLQKGQRGEVVGAAGLSLLAPANFARALDIARAELAPDHQLTNLRLSPTRLDITVRNTLGEQRSIQVGLDYDPRVNDAGTNSTTGPRGVTGIDVSAPARALAAVLARERWAPSTLDYVVYDAPQGDTPSRWDLFFTKVPIERNHVATDGSGRLIEQ